MNDPRSDATSQSPATPPSGPPAGRYDDVQPAAGIAGKLVAVLLVVLVGALLVGGAYTLYKINATPEVSAEEIALEVIDDQQAKMILNVTRDEPETPAYCIVRAQDQGKGELGRREVYIPPSESSTVRIETIVATTERAFLGDVYGCGEDVPDYLHR